MISHTSSSLWPVTLAPADDQGVTAVAAVAAVEAAVAAAAAAVVAAAAESIYMSHVSRRGCRLTRSAASLVVSAGARLLRRP